MKTENSRFTVLRERLEEWTRENVMVAFSGGADSGLLLKLACDAAARNHTLVYAVTVNTMLHPRGDLNIAERAAREAGARHQVLELDELKEAGIERNPVDRCYRCKKCIFQKLRGLADELGIQSILEGTNADDLHEYRPGIRALKELDIISPLAACGMTKKEIRELAARHGLSVAERPSSPCLATRLPYGSLLTSDRLKRIEEGEALVRDMGFYNVRLRLHGDVARIEVDAADIHSLLLRRNELTENLKKLGFHYITMDLEGFRSGSMDTFVDKA